MGISIAATLRVIWQRDRINQRGVSFLELLMALAIFSIAMLGLCAASLQALRITQETLQKTAELITIQNERF